MQDIIKAEFKESVETKNLAAKTLAPKIEEAARLMIEALKAGRKILFFGNGGSAADSQHLAAELIGRYRKERASLPAIALTTDTSILTAVGNDYGFDTIFARQIEGLAEKGDVAFGISTSGNSKNVIEGILKAKEKGCKTIGLLGCDGGRIGELADLPIVAPCKATPRIQECHILIGHILCSLIEQELFA
ncbi:D-sedoheptulose 7-phosphate isomerase [Candidatus Saganbacteria bacterium]|nr:D-sedoheptulose 7-phosphate isomerase [Candidatus Saganbacteria bacterium]